MMRWTVHLEGRADRNYQAAVAVGHMVYSFGGCVNLYDTDQIGVHVFNTVSLHWMKSPPMITDGGEHLQVPSMRVGHTAVLIEDMIYIWGGVTYTVREYCNILYAFDVDTHRWFKPMVSGTLPQARYSHSACVLGKVMYIFGGSNQLLEYTNGIYRMDTSTMVWSLINTRGTSAPVSDCHSATIIGAKMFVFGGRGDQHMLNNINVFDTETYSWLSTPPAQVLPEGRECHSAFAYKGELYIFGGFSFLQDRTFNDMWKFNPETFSWKKVEPRGKVPSSWKSRMGCCKVEDRIILFGGNRYTTVSAEDHDDEEDEKLADLYILDLGPSLKTLCKLAVIQYGLEQSGLPHDIRWEVLAMTTKQQKKQPTNILV